MHADLIERLERAETADPQLNEAVLLHFGWTTKDGCVFDPDGNKSTRIPDLVGSLDAALALMERALPGIGWNIDGSMLPLKRGIVVQLFRHEDGLVNVGDGGLADTAPIAVLIALLNALNAQTLKGEDNDR